MKTKLYTSEKWLRLHFITKGEDEKTLADLAGVNQATINRWLRRYQIRK